MSELLNDIEKYWTGRAAGYSEYNQTEVESGQKIPWANELLSHLPKKDPSEIRILDAGTGPGFFAILLAEAGYQVTAVDYTAEMIKEAKANAGDLADKIEWHQMDVQNLEFEDQTFDAVVSRNVTWVLEHPEQAYSEWHRVLKPGGVMINSDANWYGYLFDEELHEAFRQDRKNAKECGVEDLNEGTGVDVDEIERIARQVPLSRISRPAWDMKMLRKLAFRTCYADREAGERILSDMEKINCKSTPVFMVYAEK